MKRVIAKLFMFAFGQFSAGAGKLYVKTADGYVSVNDALNSGLARFLLGLFGVPR